MKRTIKGHFVDDKNAYYKQFYEDCYRNNFEDDDYIDVRKYLHKIVKHYYIKIKNVYEDPHINSFKPIVDIFNMLIEENNFDNLDNNINFLFIINKFSVQFGPQLYALMSPDKYFEKYSNEYINVFFDFFWNYQNMFRKVECPKNSNTRIQDILECFMKYYRPLETDWGYDELKCLCSRIGAIFYMSGRDISELDSIFNDLFNNFKDIKDRFILNTVLDDADYYLEFANYVLNNKLDSPKIIIK